MNIELTEKEEYFIEKHMDLLRDNMLRGIGQAFELASKSPDYKLFFDKQVSQITDSYDLINCICYKLEKARLESKLK